MKHFQPEIGLFHDIFAAHVEQSSSLSRVSFRVGYFPLSFDPPSSPAPVPRRPANHAPVPLGIDLGGLKPPPSCAMHHHASLENTFGNSPLRTIPKIRRPLQRPKTSVGSGSAHGIASGSLASSESEAGGAGAPPRSAFRPSFVFPSTYHWCIPFWPSSFFVGSLVSRSLHRPTAAAGNCGQPS